MLLRFQEKMGILRVPMVFGNGSPRIKEIKKFICGKRADRGFSQPHPKRYQRRQADPTNPLPYQPQ